MQRRTRLFYHLIQMVRFLRIFVAVLCIVCILALCIAPFADIPLTVMKALQVVIMLMFGLMGSILLIAGSFCRVQLHESGPRVGRGTPMRCMFLPLEMNCVQRC